MATEKPKAKSTPEVVDTGAGTQAGEKSTDTKGVKALNTTADGGGTQASGTATMPAQQVSEKKPLADSAQGAGLDTDGSNSSSQSGSTSSGPTSVDGPTADREAAAATSAQSDPDVNQPSASVEQMRLDTSFASQSREAPYLEPEPESEDFGPEPAS